MLKKIGNEKVNQLWEFKGCKDKPRPEGSR
jgi:hypothetical protein